MPAEQTLGSIEGKLGAHKHQEKSRCPGSKTDGTDAGELGSRAELSCPAPGYQPSLPFPHTIFSALLRLNSKLLGRQIPAEIPQMLVYPLGKGTPGCLTLQTFVTPKRSNKNMEAIILGEP